MLCCTCKTPHMTSNTYVTGLDLKLERVAARLRQRQIGDAMGVSGSRVAAIEREAVVSAETVARYREAMRVCSTRTSAVGS